MYKVLLYLGGIIDSKLVESFWNIYNNDTEWSKTCAFYDDDIVINYYYCNSYICIPTSLPALLSLPPTAMDFMLLWISKQNKTKLKHQDSLNNK